MKKCVILIWICLLGIFLRAERVVIVSEDFENSCNLFNIIQGAPCYYSGYTPNNDYPSNSPRYASGYYSIGVENGNIQMISNTIDTSCYSDIELTLRDAAISLYSGNGMDSGDYISIYISPDNGITIPEIIRIYGNNNCFWSFSGGTGIAQTSYPNKLFFTSEAGGERTSDGYSKIKITNIPSTMQLKIKIWFKCDSNELWLIDDLKLTGIPIPLSVPFVNQPTAISYEGFTAHWNAIQYATNYTIQISTTSTFEEILWESNPITKLSFRVQNLEPQTTYYYRIKASNIATSSEFSEVKSVTTSERLSGFGSGTIIDGNSVNILVTPLNGFTNNDVEITPNQPTNADFTVNVSRINNDLIFNIACSDISQLNGEYILHHEGSDFYPNYVYTSGGDIERWLTNDSSTEIKIQNISSKGNVDITLQQEETLPVELTNFNAHLDYRNRIRLQWVTQSEANLLGYYIYRNCADNFSSAKVVSPLIGATNTSQQQIYAFTDETINAGGIYYYWLQSIDYNASENIFGPSIYKFELPETGVGVEIPLQEGIRSVYPNPCNPATTINYELEGAETVQLSIYNLKGQRVVDKTFEHSGKGSYNYFWNGCDERGKECATGIYNVIMRCGERIYIRKLTLLK
ncbi:MAG: T9SS type A sorting domain-containing protein [Candidatus Cloacimonas sp.]|nr:T9SS type A sorting domain-containing protein [Candidatus Cloacimonas sp.]